MSDVFHSVGQMGQACRMIDDDSRRREARANSLEIIVATAAWPRLQVAVPAIKVTVARRVLESSVFECYRVRRNVQL